MSDLALVLLGLAIGVWVARWWQWLVGQWSRSSSDGDRRLW